MVAMELYWMTIPFHENGYYRDTTEWICFSMTTGCCRSHTEYYLLHDNACYGVVLNEFPAPWQRLLWSFTEWSSCSMTMVAIGVALNEVPVPWQWLLWSAMNEIPAPWQQLLWSLTERTSCSMTTVTIGVVLKEVAAPWQWLLWSCTKWNFCSMPMVAMELYWMKFLLHDNSCYISCTEWTSCSWWLL